LIAKQVSFLLIWRKKNEVPDQDGEAAVLVILLLNPPKVLKVLLGDIDVYQWSAAQIVREKRAIIFFSTRLPYHFRLSTDTKF
jgi:hypothetical protein